MFEEKPTSPEQCGKYLIITGAARGHPRPKEEPRVKDERGSSPSAPPSLFPPSTTLVAHHVETGEEFDVVNVFKQSLTDRQLVEIQRELTISQHLGPLPNIRRLVDIVETSTGLFLFYSCPPHLSQRRRSAGSSLILDSQWEIYGGEEQQGLRDDDEDGDDASPSEVDLLEYLRMVGKISEEEAKLIFAQAVAAVCACHERFVVHRDLKLPAFLIDPESKFVRLSGLAHASILSSPEELMRDRRGSPAYVSPEILMGKPYSGQLADCWALGVILYKMLTGNYPYEDTDPRRLFEKILRGGVTFPSSLSPPSLSLLRGLLSHFPQSRFSPFLALGHPWLRGSSEDDQMVPDME